MGHTAEVGLGQEFATAEVGVEVEGVIKGGQVENERGPQIRRICGKLRIRKCDLRKRNRDNHPSFIIFKIKIDI